MLFISNRDDDVLTVALLKLRLKPFYFYAVIIIIILIVIIYFFCKVKADDIDNDGNVMMIMNTFKMIVFFNNVFFSKLFKFYACEIMNCMQINTND